MHLKGQYRPQKTSHFSRGRAIFSRGRQWGGVVPPWRQLRFIRPAQEQLSSIRNDFYFKNILKHPSILWKKFGCINHLKNSWKCFKVIYGVCRPSKSGSLGSQISTQNLHIFRRKLKICTWNIIFEKSQFSDGEVIFGQTLLVLDQFGYVLSIPELRNAFSCILRRKW